MLTVAIIGLLIGGGLGLRFKVYVLIPAIGFALLANTVLSICFGRVAGTDGRRHGCPPIGLSQRERHAHGYRFGGSRHYQWCFCRKSLPAIPHRPH